MVARPLEGSAPGLFSYPSQATNKQLEEGVAVAASSTTTGVSFYIPWEIDRTEKAFTELVNKCAFTCCAAVGGRLGRGTTQQSSASWVGREGEKAHSDSSGMGNQVRSKAYPAPPTDRRHQSCTHSPQTLVRHKNPHRPLVESTLALVNVLYSAVWDTPHTTHVQYV